MLVGPELASSTDTGLHFVDDHEHAVALGDVTETLEESGGSMVITTLGLDGFNNDGSDGVVPLLDQPLGLSKTALLLRSVLRGELVKRVLQLREGSLGPVKGGDIELVNRLAAGSRERTEETSVECRLE